MKTRLTIFGAAVVAAGSFLIMMGTHEPGRSRTKIDPDRDLLASLEQLDPGTPEYSRTLRLWTSLRIKRDLAHIHAESPGVFENALSEIKVNRAGKTYPSNYKVIQLEKAVAARTHARAFSKAAVPLPWVERGPGNVSGRVRDILVDPDNPTTHWYIASVGGGIWKTTDAGVTWANKTPLLTTLSTMTIGMAESNPDIMYVGTGMGFGRLVDLAGSGVWKSTDRGETWFQLSSTANGEVYRAINRLVVDPENPDVVVLCSNDDYTSFGPNGGQRVSGIFKTTDGGTTWYQTFDADAALGTATDNRVQQIIANPVNFNTLYATVNEVGVIKSTDGGESWFVSAGNFADPNDIGFGEGSYQGISTRTEMAIATTDTSRLYAAVERRRGTAKLFMSTNAGATWSEVVDTGSNPNWFTGGGASGATGAYTAGWFDNTIAVHPYNANLVLVGGVEIYGIVVNPATSTRSTSLFASTAQVHADHHRLTGIPIDAGTNTFTILDANDGGIAISTNGGTSWQSIKGQGTTQFYGVDKKIGSDQYFGGMQDNGTWISPDNSSALSNWSPGLGGDGVEVAWSSRDPNLMLGGSQYGVYSRSTDGGISWYALPQATAGASPFVSKIAASKIDPDLVFTVGSAGINRSDDFGATWNLTPITGNWIGYRAFDNVEISVADPQIVWATSRLDLVSFVGKKGGIHVSTDGGVSFSEVSANLPATLTESSGFGTHPSDRETAYALFSAAGTPKVMRTTDLGQTWEDLSQFDAVTHQSLNGFPDVAVFSLLVMPYDTAILWAGTEIGLFISSDGGSSWSIADNGLPRVGIFQMSIVDEEILLATYGRGIWTVKPPELAGYKPPAATLSPRLKPLAHLPTGLVQVGVDLRSAYDSTVIMLNNQVLARLPANTAGADTGVFYPITGSQTVSAAVTSYKNGQSYVSPTRSITVFPTTAQDVYANNFNAATSDFIGNGFTISTASGFSNGAIHSPHPYANNTQLTYQLKIPIVVQENSSTLQYDDVALIEEGLPNTLWTNPNFFDYVVVEGTKDGINWLPLADGYDARFNPVWSAAYNSAFSGQNSTAAGNSSMFVHHTLDLLNLFDPGDVIFVRFRLLADPGAWAWGWAIDNVVINGDVQLPVLTLGALASPVLNVVRFGVGANESLSSATVSVNGQPLTMTQQGRLFFGDYTVGGSGSLAVVAGGSDSSFNAGTPINRTYTVAPITKAIAMSAYRLQGSGQGYIVAAPITVPAAPPGWTSVGSAIDIAVVGAAKVTISMTEPGALPQVGFYRWDGNHWSPLVTTRSDGRLVSETSGGTIAAFHNPDIVAIPTEFSLQGNYPNPFNPTTAIAFSVPSESKVVLKVYNMLGQQVRTLVSESMPTGFHQVSWDGRNNSGQSVASGVYIYRMQADRFVQSRKMLLVK